MTGDLRDWLTRLRAGIAGILGVISSAYMKDPTDPQWKDDTGLQHWREVMRKYLPDADMTD